MTPLRLSAALAVMLSLFSSLGRSFAFGGKSHGAYISTSLLLSAKKSSSESATATTTTPTAATSDAARSKASSKQIPGKMPITVISGFLGAGKTSYLQQIINSSTEANQKYGLVVNDMATVNVDSKLIRKQTAGNSFDGIDTMELQNGCVCCTLAEDLMASVNRLVSLSEMKGTAYDHIVVECSGIAEPRKIRELFQEAEDYNSPLTAKTALDTLITLVDATVFLKLYGSADADLGAHSNLAVAPEDLEGKRALAEEGTGQRRVTELILEQVECADVVLINKCDLLKNPLDVELVKKVIRSINPTARVYTSIRGMLQDTSLGLTGEALLGSAKGEGAASWGILDEHRKIVEAVKASQHATVAVAASTATTAAATECAPECNDPTHNHDHSHSHGHEHESTSASASTSSTAAECAPDCKDPTHNHDHAHSHEHASAVASCAPDCNDPTHDHDHSHSHSHDHSTASAASCAPGCNDPTHNHDHSHSHEHTTAEDRFGITSFVYQRRRPFHPARLSMFLQSLGQLSVTGISDMAAAIEAAEQNEAGASEELVTARRALLRSKGFVWMGTSSAAAYFMSHAGQFLELVVLGRWWADIPKNEWPEGSEGEITVDFDGKFGDRRQELVFIGQFGDKGTSQEALEKVLDSCLLTDEEMSAYESTVSQGKGDEALRKLFFPTLAKQFE